MYTRNDRLEVIGGKYKDLPNTQCIFVSYSGVQSVNIVLLFDGKQVTKRKRNVRRSQEKEGGKRRRDDNNASNEDQGVVTSLADELMQLKLENKSLKDQNEIILAEVVEVNAKLDKLLSRE